MEVADQNMLRVPKLRFQEFTHSWETDALKKLTKYVDYRGKAPQKSEEGVFLVTAKNIKKGYIDYEKSAEYVPRELYAAIMSKGLPAVGDIVFTTEAPMGNVAQLDRSDIALAQRVIKFRSNGKISNEYLLYYMLASPFQKDIADKAIGTTVQGISGGDLHRCLVRFPTLPEQQKIAGFLSAVDEKLKHLNRKKELLQQYKKGVMQQLFAQELRFKREDGSDYEDWEEKRLGEFITTYSGGTPSTRNRKLYEGNIPFIRSAELNSSITELYISQDALNTCSAKMVKKGDLLYAMYGATAGETGISKIEGAINQAILCIRSKESVVYLYHWLRFQKDVILSTFLQGGQGNLSADIVRTLSIQLPSKEEQQKIADFLSSLDKKIDAVGTQIKLTQQFKKGLLQEMFV